MTFQLHNSLVLRPPLFFFVCLFVFCFVFFVCLLFLFSVQGKAWAHSSYEWMRGGRRGEGGNIQTKLESKFLIDQDE